MNTITIRAFSNGNGHFVCDNTVRADDDGTFNIVDFEVIKNGFYVWTDGSITFQVYDSEVRDGL